MKKFMIAVVAIMAITFLFPSFSYAESADTTQGPISFVFAIGAGFPTSPSDNGLNVGLVKKSMVLYKLNDHVKVGGVYGGFDFNAQSLMDNDLIEYGGIAILHTMLSNKIGAFFKVQITSQTFNGGPAELGQMTGFGLYLKQNEFTKFVPFVGADLIPVDIATKTNAATLYGGIEVMGIF